MTILSKSFFRKTVPTVSAVAMREIDAQPEILVQLRKLDTLLKTAIARVRLLSAGNEDDEALRGLYISDDEIDSLMKRQSGDASDSDESVVEARIDFLSSSWLSAISGRWPFTDFDNAVLILALAPELDLRYERIYAYLQDDVTKRRPTVDLALNLLCSGPQERLDRRLRFASDAPLIRSGMLRLLPDPALIEPPLLAQYLRLGERAVGALLGDNNLDCRLASFCAYHGSSAQSADILYQSDIAQRLPAFAAAAQTAGRQVRLLFSGPATSGKREAAAALAQSGDRTLLTVELARSPAWKNEPAVIASLLAQEATLSGSLLYVSGLRWSPTEEEAGRVFVDRLLDHPDTIIIASESPSINAIIGSEHFLDVAFRLPDYETRHELWRSLAAEAGIMIDTETATTLAGNFVLAPEEIAAAVNFARQQLDWKTTALAGLENQAAAAELLAAARRQSGGELAALTSKVRPVHRWEDIVLAEDALQQLKEISARFRFGHQVLEHGGFGKKLSSGKGIAALFVGPSGTGKTMAAEVIANDLNLDLYRIDLSRVVSKYIGETEQNLERIFNAAVRSNSVLLFDEADSLLGKRSAVHDAHDRYANMEISYLLQKMEQHEGIAILTTNLRGNIDDAFLRRLAFMVQFLFPEEEARLKIWKRVWPPETAVDSAVDFAALANRFRLSGGNISNIGLSAAFLAAEQARPVGMADILRATQREYAKVGKKLSIAELNDVVR
ncbi:ATP-binding protein [Bradyrhizobium diazoefficiens]